jgi:hypothetical protein
MKAALEAWGASSNLFHQGAAKESTDPGVIAATMKKPGIVLRMPPVGAIHEAPPLAPVFQIGHARRRDENQRAGENHLRQCAGIILWVGNDLRCGDVAGRLDEGLELPVRYRRTVDPEAVNMLDLAKHIVNQKAGSFEPEEFEDHYETALVDLINQKRAGKPIRPKERPKGKNVVDLMEALRRSVGGASGETKAPKKPAKKSKRAAAGQKEVLMPIAGKKPAKETAAKKPAARGAAEVRLGTGPSEGRLPWRRSWESGMDMKHR